MWKSRSQWEVSPLLAASTDVPEGARALPEGICRHLVAGADIGMDHNCIHTNQCSGGMQGDT